MTRAKDVFNAEMLAYVASPRVRSTPHTTAETRALRSEERLREARARFPGISDYDALQRLRDEEIDRNS
jgi:hypothetical protein